MATTTISDDKPIYPAVKWAQRKDRIYVTLDVEDIDSMAEVKLNNSTLYFHGKAGHENKIYEVQLEFYGAVDPKHSKELRTGREMFFDIHKKESGFWPRLLKVSGKVHYVKVDFNRWRDEDDSEEDMQDDRSLEDMMRQMSSGTTDLPDMDDLKAPDSDDSDDEDLPDLEETADTKE
ncbi:prostaglandin E synthase 3-like [Amphiura filiformis]|uniref:prostaglandin E synthase 3-like n=1 Tax=Amphiura filiformis TaxID=82378 RepID=UPI003B225688